MLDYKDIIIKHYPLAYTIHVLFSHCWFINNICLYAIYNVIRHFIWF